MTYFRSEGILLAYTYSFSSAGNDDKGSDDGSEERKREDDDVAEGNFTGDTILIISDIEVFGRFVFVSSLFVAFLL